MMFRRSSITCVQIFSFFFIALLAFVPTAWGEHLDVQIDVIHNGCTTEYHYEKGDNAPSGNVIHIWPGDNVTFVVWPFGTYFPKIETVTFTLTGEEQIFSERVHTTFYRSEVGIQWFKESLQRHAEGKLCYPGVYSLTITCLTCINEKISWKYHPTLVFHESDSAVYDVAKAFWRAAVYDQNNLSVIKREYSNFDGDIDVYQGERLVMKTDIGSNLGRVINGRLKLESCDSSKYSSFFLIGGSTHNGIYKTAIDCLNHGIYRIQIERKSYANQLYCEVATSLGKVTFHEGNP